MTVSPELLLIPAVGYLASGALFARHLHSRREGSASLAAWVAVGVIAVHAVIAVARFASAPYAPFASMAESLSLYGLVCAALSLYLQRTYRAPALGCVILPVCGLAVVAAAMLSPERVAALPQLLRSPWFFIHIPLCLLGYVAMMLAFGVSMLYLLHDGLLRHKRLGILHRHLPPLNMLEHIARRLVAFGFPVLTAGLIAGVVWARSLPADYTGWHAKGSAALVTWLLYAAALHARNLAGWRGRKYSWLLTLGFASIVVGYVVVSLVNPGAHDFR
jgi:cytochrome c-type biogenesis protein CcsB